MSLRRTVGRWATLGCAASLWVVCGLVGCGHNTLSVGRDDDAGTTSAADSALPTDARPLADAPPPTSDASGRCGALTMCPASTVCCPADQPCHDTCVRDCRLAGAGCMGSTVCCPTDLACRGNCLPDCRIDGQPGCPSGMACEPATGLCR